MSLITLTILASFTASSPTCVNDNGTAAISNAESLKKCHARLPKLTFCCFSAALLAIFDPRPITAPVIPPATEGATIEVTAPVKSPIAA